MLKPNLPREREKGVREGKGEREDIDRERESVSVSETERDKEKEMERCGKIENDVKKKKTFRLLCVRPTLEHAVTSLQMQTVQTLSLSSKAGLPPSIFPRRNLLLCNGHCGCLESEWRFRPGLHMISRYLHRRLSSKVVCNQARF